MGYGWFAIAATAGLGLAGIVATFWQAKQGRDQTERMARERLDHERRMAREDRQQERLADAYVRLLHMAEKAGAWAQRVRPIMDTTPPQEPPPLPDLDVQIEAEAIVNAYGSSEVQKVFEQWRRIVVSMTTKVELIDLEMAESSTSRSKLAICGAGGDARV